MSDAPDVEVVRQQVSPGNPHEHRFQCASPGGTWSGDADFAVHRPTRGEMASVRAYQAASLGRNGLVNVEAMNALDGRMILIESYLTAMLDRAPAQWWMQDKDGGLLDGREVSRDGKKARVERAVTFDHVYEEDLNAVWRHVAPYLRSFGVDTRIPDEPGPAP